MADDTDDAFGMMDSLHGKAAGDYARDSHGVSNFDANETPDQRSARMKALSKSGGIKPEDAYVPGTDSYVRARYGKKSGY